MKHRWREVTGGRLLTAWPAARSRALAHEPTDTCSGPVRCGTGLPHFTHRQSEARRTGEEQGNLSGCPLTSSYRACPRGGPWLPRQPGQEARGRLHPTAMLTEGESHRESPRVGSLDPPDLPWPL